MIEVEGLHKSFGKRPAVTDLSLSVPAGSVYGLLGHNGAGKSTTLGALLGQVFPDAGSVRIHGHDVFRHRADALREVGAIFEAPCFYDYMTGYRNLRAFCDYTARVSRKQLDEVVELVNLTDRIHDKVGTYSHGMRQRLALAQALLPGPRTLILDEPTDGLDPQGIAEFRRIIRRLHEDRGLTILFSSHLLAEVEQVCDRVAVLHRGRKVFDGDWSAAATSRRLFELETDRDADAGALLRQRGLIEPGRDPRGRYTLAGDATTARVTACLVAAGFAVSRMAPARLSLEDFYLLTIGETPPAEEA